jgi:hypothetical protein
VIFMVGVLRRVIFGNRIVPQGRITLHRTWAQSTDMTRIVGPRPRDEFILDPTEAWHRGRRLDAMLAGALPRRPRGILRATHEALNRLDDARQLEMARRLNLAPGKAAGYGCSAPEGFSDAD